MYFESGGDKVRKSPWITAKFGDFQKEYRFVPLLQKSVIAAAILGGGRVGIGGRSSLCGRVGQP